jgi:hypothetical protein
MYDLFYINDIKTIDLIIIRKKVIIPKVPVEPVNDNSRGNFIKVLCLYNIYTLV